MRILVTGDRNGFDDARLREELDILMLKAEGNVVLIHGAARGVDTQAAEWARMRGLKAEAYPADWEKFGRRAGPIRNSQMLKEGKPDLVVAFHHALETSRGTANMVHIARRAGVETKVVER